MQPTTSSARAASPRLISVVLCTHNPRAEYLRRTLSGLRGQTLSAQDWEFVLVDNASRTPLGETWSAEIPADGRVVVEDSLGLTRARLRGLTETSGDIVVFVDDDNILSPDYLAQVQDIAYTKPFVGAWGGSIAAEFELPPPAWSRDFHCCLALRNVDREVWTNSPQTPELAPYGAGLCVRRGVAAHWVSSVRSDLRRLELDRKGVSLASAGDTDLALSACDLGLGYGLFPQLHLTHLIPKERLTLPYFERLLEGVANSDVLLRSIWHPSSLHRPYSRLRHWLRRYELSRMPREIRRLQEAIDRGRENGYHTLARAQPPLAPTVSGG